MKRRSGTFDCAFDLAAWQFFFNCQTKFYFQEGTVEISLANFIYLTILGQFAKLNIYHAMFIAKLPNFIYACQKYHSFGM